jgi:hypothetical protein
MFMAFASAPVPSQKTSILLGIVDWQIVQHDCLGNLLEGGVFGPVAL